MFGNGNELFGSTGWLLCGADNSPATGDAYQGVFAALNWTGVPLYAKFFFQLVFAGTAADHRQRRRRRAHQVLVVHGVLS